MTARRCLHAAIRCVLFASLICTFGLATIDTVCAETAQGVVFDDQNGNGQRDADEPGLAGVQISNGLDIVKTDADGRYAIPVTDDTIVFVIKPRDWSTPLSKLNLPQFYYIHKPAGSPDDDYEYPGVEPTGPLPESIDFPLIRSPEPDQFDVIVMGDPQPASPQQVRYYANDVLAELVDTKAKFAIAMGDVVGDRLNLYDEVNAVQATLGIPWYNVQGNHDENYQALDDRYANETFERIYGPTDYAFQYGPVHFIILDNIQWNGANRSDSDRPYEGRLTERQLKFVENLLQNIPTDERVVICTHIPLPAVNPLVPAYHTKKFRRLLEILSGHPNTVSFSAHMHTQTTYLIGAADGYTPEAGTLHPHHNVATGSGSWYTGPRDEQGFPITPMADGVPNGYVIATFDGHDYHIRYKAARMPEDFQMSIFVPETVESEKSDQTEVVVNVFGGSEQSVVRMRVRVGKSDWLPMRQEIRTDPHYVALHYRVNKKAGDDYHALTGPRLTPHIWVAKLPGKLPPGVHVLEVESTDMFDQVDRAGSAD